MNLIAFKLSTGDDVIAVINDDPDPGKNYYVIKDAISCEPGYGWGKWIAHVGDGQPIRIMAANIVAVYPPNLEAVNAYRRLSEKAAKKE